MLAVQLFSFYPNLWVPEWLGPGPLLQVLNEPTSKTRLDYFLTNSLF